MGMNFIADQSALRLNQPSISSVLAILEWDKADIKECLKQALARTGRDDEGCGLRAHFMPVKALKASQGWQWLLWEKTLSSREQEKWALLSRVFCALQLVSAMSATGIAKA